MNFGHVRAGPSDCIHVMGALLRIFSNMCGSAIVSAGLCGDMYIGSHGFGQACVPVYMLTLLYRICTDEFSHFQWTCENSSVHMRTHLDMCARLCKFVYAFGRLQTRVDLCARMRTCAHSFSIHVGTFYHAHRHIYVLKKHNRMLMIICSWKTSRAHANGTKL